MSTTCHFTHEQATISSESANQWTHALGWGLSLIGGALLVRAVADCDDAWRAWGCGVYAGALVGVYAASTLSHAVTHQLWRSRFRMLDQICIFLLVVGTYTAYAATYARDGWLGSMLAVMWVIALLGIFARIRSGDESVSFTWYVALGWIPILALGRILDTTGLAGTALALGGGVVYTAGTWFLVNDHKHPHFHAVWHCFTMLGSLIHFVYVYQYVAMAPIG
jgi:hemolysin III